VSRLPSALTSLFLAKIERGNARYGFVPLKNVSGVSIPSDPSRLVEALNTLNRVRRKHWWSDPVRDPQAALFEREGTRAHERSTQRRLCRRLDKSDGWTSSERLQTQGRELDIFPAAQLFDSPATISRITIGERCSCSGCVIMSTPPHAEPVRVPHDRRSPATPNRHNSWTVPDRSVDFINQG
jgi:hypothetical protein